MTLGTLHWCIYLLVPSAGLQNVFFFAFPGHTQEHFGILFSYSCPWEILSSLLRGYKLFSCSTQLSTKFTLLMNVKM